MFLNYPDTKNTDSMVIIGNLDVEANSVQMQKQSCVQYAYDNRALEVPKTREVQSVSYSRGTKTYRKRAN